MTYVIKVNCRQAGIGLLATLWIVSSFFSGYGAYLNYLTSQSYDAQNDCHFNYIINQKFCQSVCDKNSHAYEPDYVCPPAKSQWFVNVEYGMIVFTMLIQFGAFIILNAWKHWIGIECSVKQNPNEVKQE